jgi:hypothetical protein
MDIGRTGDKENTNAERRKKAGLPDDSKSGKFIINNWFRLVVIGFLVMFTYQLNEIKNDNYINGYVTVDDFGSGAMKDLRRIRNGD